MTTVTPDVETSGTCELVHLFAQPTANVTMTPEFLDTFSKTARYRSVQPQQLDDPALIKTETDHLPDESSLLFDFEALSEPESPPHLHKQTSELPDDSPWCRDNAYDSFSSPSSTSLSHKNLRLSASDAPHMSGWATEMGLRPMSPPPSDPCSPALGRHVYSNSSHSGRSLSSNGWGMLNWGTDFPHTLSPPTSVSFSPEANQHYRRPRVFPSMQDDPFSALPDPDLDEGASVQDGDTESIHRKLNEGTRGMPSEQGEAGGKPSKKRKEKPLSTSSTQTNTRSSNRPRTYASRAEGKGSEEAKEARRLKFLQRNRIAAAKCRDKKRNWTDNLGNRARDLKERNTVLGATVESLQGEIEFLKSEVQKHKACGETREEVDEVDEVSD